MTAFNSASSFRRAPQQGQVTSKSTARFYRAGPRSKVQGPRSKVAGLEPPWTLDFGLWTLPLEAFDPPSFTSLPLVRPSGSVSGRKQAVEPPSLGDLRRHRRRDIFVEPARLRFRDGTIGQGPNDDLARIPPPRCNRQAVARLDLPVRLGARPVDVHLASLTGRLRLGARREEARRVQPHIQADRLEGRTLPRLLPHPASESAGESGSGPAGDSSGAARRPDSHAENSGEAGAGSSSGRARKWPWAPKTRSSKQTSRSSADSIPSAIRPTEKSCATRVSIFKTARRRGSRPTPRVMALSTLIQRGESSRQHRRVPYPDVTSSSAMPTPRSCATSSADRRRSSDSTFSTSIRSSVRRAYGNCT